MTRHGRIRSDTDEETRHDRRGWSRIDDLLLPGRPHGVQEAAGEQALPPITIESLSVFAVLEYCSRRDYDGLTGYLSAAIDRLAGAGVQLATLTGLTPHIVFDRLREQSSIPLVSAVEAVRDAALADGSRRLALLGTEHTMTEDFFAGPLREAGLDVVTRPPRRSPTSRTRSSANSSTAPCSTARAMASSPSSNACASTTAQSR